MIELKQAAQQALEALRRAIPKNSEQSIEQLLAIQALSAALEQRPTAQEVPSVTLSSAIAAIEHVSAHNGPGRQEEATSMLRLTNDPAMRERIRRASLPTI